MNYIVYMHISPSQKKYIGITCTSTSKRWKNGKGYKDSVLFYNAIKKYGWENIEHLILHTNLSSTEAKEKEKELIKSFKTNDRKYGYNLTAGGDGAEGYRHSEETRKLMSKNHADFKGEKNPMYGTDQSGEKNPRYISDMIYFLND
jgi:group I intron endonuclease